MWHNEHFWAMTGFGVVGEFRAVDPSSPGALLAMGHYLAEVEAAFGFAGGTALEDAKSAFVPPRGIFLLSGPDDDPLACGGVQVLTPTRGEVKRMWVSPAARGQGLAGRLLSRLEAEVLALGCSEAVLDTNSALAPAVRLYERAGYERVPDYNHNPDADLWFAKELGSPTR